MGIFHWNNFQGSDKNFIIIIIPFPPIYSAKKTNIYILLFAMSEIRRTFNVTCHSPVRKKEDRFLLVWMLKSKDILKAKITNEGSNGKLACG